MLHRADQSVEVASENPEQIAEFILRRIGRRREDIRTFQALGAYRGETLLGGFLYLNYSEIGETGKHSIDMHMAGDPGWLTRRTLYAFFRYPFLQLECNRVVGSISASNQHAKGIAERIGCKLDGRIRSGIAPEHDTCVYTMTRAECPWI